MWYNQGMSAVYLPEAAISRIMSGDSDLLIDGLRRGLKPSILWPMWDAPLLHGICFLCPPKAALMAKAVVDAGATLDTEWKGLTALLCAVAGYNDEKGDSLGARTALVQFLAEHTPKEEWSLAVRLAVKRGYQECVAFFIDAGFDVNSSYPDGSTLLHEGYYETQKGVSKLLVESGADPEQADHKGATPFMALPPSMPREEKEAFALDVESQAAHPKSDHKPPRL